MNQIIKLRRIRGVLDSKIFLIIMIIIAFVFGKAAFFMNKQKNETQKMVANITSEFNVLNERYSNAQKDLEYMNSNTGKEKEIRERFDLGREGEKAIFIIEEKPAPVLPKEPGNIDKFLTSIKNLFGIND